MPEFLSHFQSHQWLVESLPSYHLTLTLLSPSVPLRTFLDYIGPTQTIHLKVSWLATLIPSTTLTPSCHITWCNYSFQGLGGGSLSQGWGEGWWCYSATTPVIMHIWDEVLFFLLLWDITDIYMSLKCMWFDTGIFCKMINTIRLVNLHPLTCFVCGCNIQDWLSYQLSSI